MKRTALALVAMALALPCAGAEWALTTGTDTYDDPEWCEHYIICYSDRDPSVSFDIWVVEVDGAGQFDERYRITQQPNENDVGPTWEVGQCGYQFYFERQFTAAPSEIHVGTTLTSLSQPITLGSSNEQAPDRCSGDMLVHNDRAGNNNVVWIDHGGEAQGWGYLTTNPADDRNACWSPDENWIAFASDRSGNWDIWVMSALGEVDSLRQLTNTPENETMPAWSPTGEFIAYARDGAEPGIWCTDAWGRTQYHVTEDATDSGPTWNDTGSMMAFSRETGGGRNIWVTDNLPQSPVVPMSWGRVKALYRRP